MICKISEISPEFYGVHYINYTTKSNRYTRMASTKSHYVYRLLYYVNGCATMTVNDQLFSCDEGSIVYLPPGVEYNILPQGQEFCLLNLFFDFFPYDGADRKDQELHCIFKQDFHQELCSKAVTFSDAAVFNGPHLFENTDCGHIFKELLCLSRTNPLWELYSKTAIMSLLCTLLKKEQEHDSSINDTIHKIIAHIQLEVSNHLTPQSVADAFGYHPNYINHLIKQHTGFTLSEYIRKAKIQYAKVLLLETEMTAAQVAQELGYYDCSHFYKAFLTETGQSPGQYQRSI